MPWRDRHHLQTPGNWTLWGLLFVMSFLPHLPSANSYFMSESKATFHRGCSDYWSLQDSSEMPLLHQVSVCMEVRILSPGQWTAFTYRTLQMPHYDLALGGGGQGLEVWLLGAQHHFSVVLQFHRWHHICLRHNSLSNILRLEVDNWAAERTVVGQAIPPAGELLLGCQVQELQAARQEAVQLELYLFRVWKDIQQHGACEDGDIVGWDSSQWTVAGESKTHDDSLLCALPVVGRLLPTLLPRTKAAPDSSSESNVMAASSVLAEVLGQSWHAALTVNSTSASLTPDGKSRSRSDDTVPATSTVTGKLTTESAARIAQNTFTNTDPYTIQEVMPVPCNFSHFCTIDEVYYWIAVAVETNGDNTSAPNISSWLAGVFDRVPRDPAAAEATRPTVQRAYSYSTNSTRSVPLRSITSSPSYNRTGISSDSMLDTLEATSRRKERRCTNQGKGSFTLLQNIEVTCDSKEVVRKTTCTVLLQLSPPTDTLVLKQLLQKAGASASVEAHILGDAERAATGLCLTEDSLPPVGRFMRCSSFTPLPSISVDDGLVSVTCRPVESEDLFAEFQRSGKEICREDQQICNCSSFCSDEAAYYTLVLNVTSPIFTMTDLKTTISQLGLGSDCKSIPQDHCVLIATVAQAYQGVHLECHGTEIRLHSCMVMVKMAHPLDVCALSSVVSSLLQSNTDIAYDGIITRAAICGWLSEPSYDLLDSNFTWVSTDLSLSQICGEHDPIILTCQENETLIVLLNETCKDPSTPKANEKILNFSTVNITVQPLGSTEYNTTALASNATQYNTTDLLSNATQYKTTDLLSSTIQYNTTALPSFDSATDFTLKPTQGNLTAFLHMNITYLYTTDALSNTKTKQTTTTMNTTTGMVSSNTTSSITTATATNSTWPPVPPTEMPTTFAPEHSTVNSTPVMSLEEHAIRLLNQTRDLPAVNSTLMGQWVSQLEGLLSGPNISLALGSTVVSIVSNLLHSSTDVLAPFSTRIIRIVDTVGLKLVLKDDMETVSAESLALAVTKVNGLSFRETSFSISDPSSLQISVRDGARSGGSALFLGSITLPPSLTDGLTSQEQMIASRVQFSFYQKSTVFQDRGLGSRKLNSGVLGTGVANLSIDGLKEDLVITLKNREPVMENFVASCVFWDFSYNDGMGGWNPTGCHVQDTTYNVTVCSCDHLTSFAVLLDLSRGGITNVLQATILTYVTYIGCGISAIFLSVTLLTYLGFQKLRKDIPSKILIQLCLALLLLNVVFLLDPWLALHPDATGLCISTAFFLHYFLLVSFTWMGLEAFHMYLAFVKVFNTYVSRYMLKFSLMGWGVPLMVVTIVIAISKDNYGRISFGAYPDGSTDNFCWLKNDIAFYVAVVAYFCLVFLLNMTMFVVVLVQLCRIKRQNPRNSQHRNVLQDLRSVAGLTFLLGLTWAFAFFARGPVHFAFMYLFSVFSSLQGFFIFVFHCAIKESVRQQWRACLCCGSLRLPENSEWSRAAMQNTASGHSVIAVPSMHSSNTISTSFLASNTGSIGYLDGNESPFDDSIIIFPDDQHENVSRQRTRTSQ